MSKINKLYTEYLKKQKEVDEAEREMETAVSEGDRYWKYLTKRRIEGSYFRLRDEITRLVGNYQGRKPQDITAEDIKNVARQENALEAMKPKRYKSS